MDPCPAVVLTSSRRFRRWCTAWSALALSALAVSVWLASVASSPAVVMSVGTESFLAVYPVILVRGRVAVTARAFQARWPHGPAGPWIGWASVTGVELRHGLLLERVRITTDRPEVLFAPARFRHRADADFDAAVAELARRSRCRPRPVRHGLGRITAFWVLWLACLGLLAPLNAPWNDASWPWRHEAGRLPDVCSGFGSVARTLLPAGEETPDADILLPGSIDTQEGCTWRAGDVDTFSIGLGLTRKDLLHNACATAHDGFVRTVAGARGPDRTVTALAGLGDEARELTGGGTRPRRTAADVIVRKANVIVTVRLVTTRAGLASPSGVERIARATLARIALG
ncbi:hypothetical protein GCM10027176_39210 [Actinoallomurus bryophytorum]|uniref:Uncharacterized protein n=1 Tax=Actinoallomurus bryophytorum TaxID=1490222 RepID=A0A543CWB2_9ACTN|nr:hypothetical protein [Actinoallomurus bryophytorum]TQM01396.1 hypothetical protein FB559_7155 [Actinoallomurus bryophytorum]